MFKKANFYRTEKELKRLKNYLLKNNKHFSITGNHICSLANDPSIFRIYVYTIKNVLIYEVK